MRISRHDLRRRYSNSLVIDAGSQFSLRACSQATQQLNLLTLNVNSTMSGQTILHAFPHLFDGIGQVKGK